MLGFRHTFKPHLLGAPLALLMACLCLSSRANQLTDNLTIVGGTVLSEEGDNGAVIVFTAEQIAKDSEDGKGKLAFKAGQATARVLAIGGGGGGGGTLNKTTANYGAGGGGGAGGFVEASGLDFKGTYIISVGAGGANVAANTHGEGGDGEPTTIRKEGALVAGIADAKGGGGGGAGGSVGTTQTTVTTLYSGKGRDGGSGGGGSQTYKGSTYSFKKAGGAGTSGQGNKGGDTTVNSTSYWIGAGGGGAGGAGTDVAKYNQADGAPGGAGKASDITGSSVTYASGGAGGAMNKSGIGKVDAVKGGGGSGGTDTNTDSRDGEPGTGGGGGGGSNAMPSGRGGSGVLIVRLSGYIAGGVLVPTIPDYVYDGNIKTATVDTAYYTVSGENEKTAAGTYTITLTLTAAGKKVGWDDKYVGDSRDVKWSIAKKPIEKPTPVETSYVYTGSEQTGFTNGTWYTVSGDFKATGAGTYAPEASLNDTANTKWADEASNPRTLSWTIEKKPIDKPGATAKTWVYTGNVQTGFVENVKYYTFDDKNRSVNAGTFIPTAKLVDTKNTKWADGASDSRSDFTWTMAPQEVKKPTAVLNLVFNGKEQTGADPESAEEYTLSGHQQTNAGDYQFTARLNNPEGAINYTWLNGSGSADLTVGWSIAKKTVDFPQPPGSTPTYTYDGKEKEPFPLSDLYTIYEGVGKATAAGDYICKIALSNNTATVTNEMWTGGAVTNMTWTWKILAKTVQIPEAKTFTYEENPKGTAVERTMLDVPADADWVLDTEWSQDLTQKNAGQYGYVVKLKDPENMVWSNGETKNQTITCEIKRAENEIQNFRMNDWQAGSTESSPSATAKFGSTIKYEYRDSSTGTWSTVKLTGTGYHYVRASAPETKNWNATESILRYCVWTHPSEVFSDYVDITVSGYTGSEALTDFPVLVRIREAVKDNSGAVTNGLPGFTYARAGIKGENIRFLLAGDKKLNDQLLPFEIDRWDVTGESLVWVKVPKLLGKTTTFRMYWHTDDPKSANDPTMVWSDYIGVWHFRGTTDEEIFADATGNGLTAYPSNATYTIVQEGKIGSSIQMNDGPLFAPNYEHLVDHVSRFSYLCWMKAKYTSGRVSFGGATTETYLAPSSEKTPDGWRMQMNSKTRVYWRWPEKYTYHDVSDLTANWGMLGLIVGTASDYTGTREYACVTSLSSWNHTGSNYRVTSTTADLQLAAAGFTVDEVRLAKTARSEVWMAAEYMSVNEANFCTFGLVNVDGAWVDYWTTRPSITKKEWAEGEITEAAIKTGALKHNAVVCSYVTMPGEKTTNTVIQTEGGTYRVVCDMKPTEGYTLFEGPALLEYTVLGESPDLKIGDTSEGRILLANNDSKTDHPIKGQDYYETDPSLPTFWWHDATAPNVFMKFLRTGINHILYQRTASGASNVLWRAENVRLGSWYSNAGASASYRNYLPCSRTALPAVDPAVPISLSNVTHIVFNNSLKAVLYSPCYTNGIGTIYFDAVNGEVADQNAEIIVEVATETSLGTPPTDENCFGEDDPFFYLTHSKEGVELPEAEDMWKPVSSYVLLKQKGSNTFVHDTTQPYTDGRIKLAVQNGGADDVFYRIAAQVKKAGTLRFRIRRVKKTDSEYEERARLILLDNIIVSKTPMSANLSAVGEYDPELTGKQTLGQACALDRPFPAWTESGVRARAKIDYVTNGETADTSKFVASARFNYRWRYLNQTFVPEKLNGQDQWTTLYLDHNDIQDGVLTTVQPLVFPGAVGDIEWYYDMTIQAPLTRYIDYSGVDFGEKPVGDYVEAPRAVTNHMTIAEGDRLASGGTDWFARLREGKSDWQGLQVVIRAAGATNVVGLVGIHDMELIGDNMWRAFVSIPTNAEGTCSFTFWGNNFQTGSPTGIVQNVKVFGLSGEGQTAAIPASGTLTENGYPVLFTIDHAAGYLEFRVSDRYKTFQVGRAEYQNFNYWNDAHTTGDRFCINSADTNSVDVASMKISKAPMGTWPLFTETNHDYWDEWFEVSDYAPSPGARFEKNVFHQAVHETPNTKAWSAQNITFVSQYFVENKETVQKEKSGMAGKLLGNANGLMDFSHENAPNGIEKINLSARLGQSDVFNAFAYCRRAYTDDNYMLFVPITMSHATKEDGSVSGDMAVGASVSLVGYHTENVGCYEARCERLFSGKTIRLSLWKWTYDDQKYTATKIVERDFSQPCWTEEETAKGITPEKERYFYGMFLSFETAYKEGDDESVKSTKIICGLSKKNRIVYDKGGINNVEAPWRSFDSVTNSTVTWNGLIYNDTQNPHGWGCYGMTSKDCPAQMVMPAHQTKPYIFTHTPTEIKKNVSWYFKDKSLTFDNTFIDDRDDLNKKRKWTVNPGRTECFTNYNAKTYRWIGLHAPTDVTQTLNLYIKKRGQDESKWQLVSKPNEVTVSGYGFQAKSFDLKRPGQWDVRLRTGKEKAIDVVVDDITQYKWQAEDLPTHSENAFYYTQCVVETNVANKTHYTRMQPARADALRPVSIRSPLMQGLGKITFNYDYNNVAPNAEIWVQVATNNVPGNMRGDNGYNESIKSVEWGGNQTVGTWMTVAKYKRDAAGAEGYKSLSQNGVSSVYLGWHSHPHRKVEGIFRLFIPTNVVSAANIASTNATQNVGYGQITITGVSCSDEPGFSDRSWRGWNMRTVGDAEDSEKRMNLIDMKIEDGGTGLVGALNNSVNDVYENGAKVAPGSESWERLATSFPAIYSPLMRPINRRSGVGSVSFKARLYSTTGAPVTEKGGKVSIYGSNDPTAPSGGWKLLETHEIVGSVFSNYTWTAGGELYTAIKLEIDDAGAKSKTPKTDRIVLDEIVVGEKVPPTINFEYARPFRNNLFTKEPIADILSPAEQPLAGESWGVQTKLSLQQLTDEIDLEKGFEVYFTYKRGTNPWGHGNWTSASDPVKLVQVGDASNLVFRSVGETPQSLVEPAATGGEVVQFILTVKYFDRGGKSDEITMGSDWSQPSWFYPLDYNEENGGYDDEKNFAAYTVLDAVSPGRAWINEVNWNDGSKQQTGGIISTTNQFVEICIPSGVDMSGWKLRVTDRTGENKAVFAKLGDKGNNIPSKKVSATAVNGYEFFVLQSPDTQKAGGIRYPGTTTSAADATWYSINMGDMSSGILKNISPYQFELVRPSGIIEHQFVLDGTNTLAASGWGSDNDGTNLVVTLNEIDLFERGRVSPIRFYAGHDVARKADRKTLASVGVTGGEESEDTDNWPGGKNTWTEGMGFTPGRINENQTIPKNWFLAPNGTNSWVYFLIDTDHVSQKVGKETSRSILAVVPQGKSTNVTYSVDNWFEADICLNEKPVKTGVTGSGIEYAFSPTGTTYVVAAAQPQKKLASEFGLDEKNPYSQAVLNWLQKKYGNASADDIRLAWFQEPLGAASTMMLNLTEMYWLDIPPVPMTEAEKSMNGGTNWYFCAGIDGWGKNHIITRERAGKTVIYTNKQVEVTMYASNACTLAKWAPYTLQGLNNELSSEFGGVWTSATFKVKGQLDLSDPKQTFLPFRIFTFGPDSFAGPEGDQTIGLKPFTARIDILDPFQSPIGMNYDWHTKPNTKAFFKWALDEKEYPYTTEKLKADSTYPETL